jgi:CubicO group peptidase (beta-lactamase class C family)
MRPRFQVIRIALCMAGLAASLSAQTPAARPPQQAIAPAPAPTWDAATLEKKVDELINAYATAQGFSGSILLASQGKPLISKGYGYANAEWQIPNSPQTKFRIGSITKQFTAMLVMQLRERGRIRLEDSVCVYMEPCPAAWKPVTVHHLLTHTSGIPTYTALPAWREVRTLPRTTEQIVALFRDLPLEWTPGERYAYNNSGYFLLGVVIEKITGRKYAEVLQDMILGPLGMMDTGYDWPDSIIPRRASGYVGTAPKTNAPAIDMQHPFSAGALYSTVEDLLKWDQALYTETLLPAAAQTIMWTPFLNNYAYGWTIVQPSDATFGHRRMIHGGAINGFSAYIARQPESRVTVIVLSNNETASAALPGRDLLALYHGQPYTVPAVKTVTRTIVPVDSAVLDLYAGKYEPAPGYILTIAREENILTAQLPEGRRVELFPSSQSAFFATAADLTMTFERDGSGKVTHVSITQGGRTRRAKRID